MKLRAMPMAAVMATVMVTVTAAIPAQASAKTVTLRVWTWLADQSEAKLYKKWASDYEKTHPGVKIQLDVSGGAESSKVLANYAAGTPIDIYRIGANWLAQFASGGLIRPIDGPMLRDINRSDLLKSVDMSGTFKGKLYGWDPHISGSTLDYNTNIFDKAGIPYPDHSFTWDDLAVVARKTTISVNGKTSQWGFQNSEAYTLFRLLGHCYNSLLWDAKTGDPKFLDDGPVKAVDLVRQMVLSYGCMPSSSSPYGRDTFAAGKLAMVVEGSFMNPTYMASTKLKYKVSWTPMGTVRAFMPWPCMWVMAKGSKHPAEQWDLYRHWVGPQQSMEFTDFGGPRAYGAPVWRSVLKNPDYHVSDNLQEQIDQDDYAQPELRLGFVNTERFEAEAETTLWKIYSGKMDTRQGLDYLGKRSKAIMKYLGK